eukprot:scaffold1629_cov369-Prasinococcus_capsulatus_cf.AAC.24
MSETLTVHITHRLPFCSHPTCQGVLLVEPGSRARPRTRQWRPKAHITPSSGTRLWPRYQQRWTPVEDSSITSFAPSRRTTSKAISASQMRSSLKSMTKLVFDAAYLQL